MVLSHSLICDCDTQFKTSWFCTVGKPNYIRAIYFVIHNSQFMFRRSGWVSRSLSMPGHQPF
jgi:hypothetical protein